MYDAGILYAKIPSTRICGNSNHGNPKATAANVTIFILSVFENKIVSIFIPSL